MEQEKKDSLNLNYLHWSDENRKIQFPQNWGFNDEILFKCQMEDIGKISGLTNFDIELSGLNKRSSP